MTTYRLSTSFALIAAAAIAFVGCGEPGGDTGSVGLEQMQTTDGTCNATVGTALRSAQVCFNSGCAPGDAACDDVTAAFTGFFGNEDCAAAFAAGELNGLPGNASLQPAGPNPGAGKHIADVICSGVVQCGLCPVAPPGVCDIECEQ